MEDLLAEQIDLYHRLSRVYDNLKKKGVAKVTEGSVQARLDLLTSLWEQFSKQHSILIKGRTEESGRHDYVTKAGFDLGEESFLEQKGRLLDLLREFNRKPESAAMTSCSAGALPADERRSRATLPLFIHISDLCVTFILQTNKASITEFEVHFGSFH